MHAGLYNETNIDQFEWPDTEDGRKGKAYLAPLVKEGVTSYLLNVKTKIELLTCNQVFLPFSVNDKEYDNSYIASNYYVLKFYEEYVAKKHPFLNILQKPLLYLGGKALQLCQVNKTIFLNNWLMTNSLAPTITADELKCMLALLIKKYPKHTITFRHVDTRVKKDLYEALHTAGFHLMKTRDIFLYNPDEKSELTSSMRKVGRKDLRIMDKHGLELVRSDVFQEPDYARLLSLYEKLYHGKYTSYSPRYTEKFLKMVHEKKMVHTLALKKEGVIEGFFSYFIYNKSMMNCLFGYNLDSPLSHDLYKILTRLVIEEADRVGLIVNDGSGGDAAKLKRGLMPAPEYMGLYCAHLPLPRRWLWNTVAYFYKKFAG